MSAGTLSGTETYSPSSPSAADPVTLTLSKSGSDLQLSWTGGSAPFRVSYSNDGSFQNNVETLAAEISAGPLTVPIDTSKPLEFFEVTDGSVVSRAVQGIGYDPDPAPVVSSLSSNDLWWGQEITVSGAYFDKVAPGNLMFFNHRPQKASAAPPGGGNYASSATFTIPDDARSGEVIVQSHGKTTRSGQFLSLVAPGIGPYGTIRNVSFAYSSSLNHLSNVWVAADNTIQEIDLFLGLSVPPPPGGPRVRTTIPGLTKPYISRMNANFKILYIDGVSGAGEIMQIDAATGGTSHYAYTHAGAFTRDILPVGIATTRDGSYAFIADGSTGSIVRFPRNNPPADPIVDTFGGWIWDFPDPCGMDGVSSDIVFVSDNAEFVGYTFGESQTNFAFSTAPDVAISLEIDWDVSIPDAVLPYWNVLPTAEAYNRNAIEPSVNVHSLGAFVEGRPDGKLELDPYLAVDFTPPDYPPSAVIINNSGQSFFDYPSPNQHADRM